MIPGHIYQNNFNPGNLEYLDPPVIPVYLEVIKRHSKPSKILQDELSYTYSKDNQKTRSQRITWRCSLKNKKCKCVAIVENDRIIMRRNLHNHDPIDPITYNCRRK